MCFHVVLYRPPQKIPRPFPHPGRHSYGLGTAVALRVAFADFSAAPWHTDFGTKSSVLHLVRGVQAPGTHVRSDYPQTRHIGGRPSSHKANLIPQSKRQDTTVIVIPCLCSFNALCSPSAELPINKKRTQTLSHRESGSSTNCMVDGTGLEPVTSCTSSRCSTS